MVLKVDLQSLAGVASLSGKQVGGLLSSPGSIVVVSLASAELSFSLPARNENQLEYQTSTPKGMERCRVLPKFFVYFFASGTAMSLVCF